MAATLDRYGPCTVGRVVRLPSEALQRVLEGRAMARLVRERAGGIDPRPVTATALPQSVGIQKAWTGTLSTRISSAGRFFTRWWKGPTGYASLPIGPAGLGVIEGRLIRPLAAPTRLDVSSHSNRVAARTDNSNLLDKFFCRMDPGYTRQPRTAA
ncbi:hypothetical protein ABZ461_28355 [Actinacidiphila glaucinigra]|uniref:hypothetical protein n=1 Tax=Actinacidiphila glaucinigra TaxID=235986 RepID=UPI0033FDD50C